MIKKLCSYVFFTIALLCYSFTVNAQGYSDSSIKKVGSSKDSSKGRANLTVRSSSSTRSNDVSFIFVGQSDSKSLDGRRPSGSMKRLTRKGHERDFNDVNLQTYYYIHNRSGSKSFDFGSHTNGLIYLITLRNVDLNALKNMNSSYLWTGANTNRKYGDNEEWRSDCGRDKYRGLAYVNRRLKSYNKGIQIAAVMYDDYPTNVQIYRDRKSQTRIMTTMDSFRSGGTGDDAMAIGMKTTDGRSTDELHFRASRCVGGNGENVLASFTLKPASRGGNNNGDKWLISNCDKIEGWSSSNKKSISTNFREGRGSVKSIGSRTEDFRRTFSAKNGQGAKALEFWYYVDKPRRFSGSNQVELGSGGIHDKREYHWNIRRSKIKRGWNLIRLPFSEAKITGGTPDITRLNWFRLYRRKKGATTTRIDNIRLTTNGSSTNLQTRIATVDKQKSEFKLYPNPSRGVINLQIPIVEKYGEATIKIKDIIGQTVYQNELKGLEHGSNHRTIYPNLSNGVYFLEVITKKSRHSLKLAIGQ